MTGQATVIIGPARSGKSAMILQFYCQALREQPPGSTLWLAPNQAAVAELREQLATHSQRGLLWPGCYTFAGFATALLEAADLSFRPVDRLLKRQLLQQVVQELLQRRQLNYFAGIATSEGFLLWLDQLIGELKRQEIWPEDFANSTQRLGTRPKDQELYLLYQGYQQLLTKYDCYDREGQFWTARQLLQQGGWGPFAKVTQIVVDGFTDFNYTQHEILQLLAERAERLWITLPGEADDDPSRPAERADLFRKPRATLAELQRRIPDISVQYVNRPTPSVWPALTHIEQRLFGNPRLSVSAPNTERIEIWACEHQLGEIRHLAREIKQLLNHGDPETGPVIPERIGVIFRSLTSVAPLVREVFQEYGLPFVMGQGLPLAEAPLLITLIKLLQLLEQDWPYRQLIELLGNHYLTLESASSDSRAMRAATEYVVRKLQIPDGQANLLLAVELYLKQQRHDLEQAALNGVTDLGELQLKCQRGELAQAGLQQLAAGFACLPAIATWSEWLIQLQQFAQRLGLLKLNPMADEMVWRQILSGISTAKRWEQWQGVPPRQVTRAELLDELLMIGQATQQVAAQSISGCVRVLGAQQARTGEFAYLFLAGLTERSFPQLSGDDQLYSVVEMRSLNQAGFRFSERADRISEEMLLFYEVLARPTRRLVLSYPALDHKAEPLSPSPFLDEVKRACGTTVINLRNEIQLQPVLPDEKLAWSPREQRLRMVSQALQGNHVPLAVHTRAKTDRGIQLLAGLQSIAARSEHRVYGAHDGLLGSNAAQACLSQQFGPEHHWSTSQLEQYASCPFQFFAERVLKLSELPELGFGTDYSARGSWFHSAVTWLHRQGQLSTSALVTWRANPTAFVEQVRAALTMTRAAPRPEQALDLILHQIDQRFLERLFTNYLAQTSSYAEHSTLPFEPSHFEVAFGSSDKLDRIDSLSQSAAWEMRYNEQVLRITGQIDRIDLAPVGEQVAVAIVDYKTGKEAAFTGADFASGTRLQLPLYALAAEQFLLQEMGAVAWQIGYWSVKDQKVKPYQLAEEVAGKICPTADWKLQREQLQRRVVSLVQGIRHGEFPMHSIDEHCTTHCQFKTICRVSQSRSLDKFWSAPEMRGEAG